MGKSSHSTKSMTLGIGPTSFACFLLALFCWMVFSITPLHAQEQDSEPIIKTIISPTDGFRVDEPFHIKFNLQCPESGCPSTLILGLDPTIDFVRAGTGGQLSDTSFDFTNRHLVYSLTTKPDTIEITQSGLFVISQTPTKQPVIRIGIQSGDEGATVEWLEDLAIFPALEKGLNTTDGLTTGKSGQESPVYLRTQLDLETGDNFSYRIATANRTAETIDSLSLVTRFPDQLYPTEISSGWFTRTDPNTPLPSMVVSYQITRTETWEPWGTFESPTDTQSISLINPLLETALLAGEGITQTAPIGAIKIEWVDIPAGYRWGDDGLSQPEIKLAIGPSLNADWVEICTAADLSDDGVEPITICDSSRTKRATPHNDNFDIWAYTNLAGKSPDPNDEVEITLEVETSAESDQPIDILVDLPRWLIYQSTENDLSYLPIIDGELQEEVVQPTFDQRILPENGQVRLHWQWDGDQLVNDLPLPIIKTLVQPGVPVGTQSFPVYALSDRLNRCWGERPSSRDFLDIDQDGDTAELICRIDVEIGFEPVAGLAANFRLAGIPYPGAPFSADFDLINGGNQRLNQMDTAIRLPKGWLTAPPKMPAGLSLAYSTASSLCSGAADCERANWQAIPPADLKQVTAIRIQGEFEPLAAGERLSIRLYLAPPADLAATSRFSWDSILLNATTEKGESVSFRYQPPPLDLSTPPVGVTGGQVFEDENSNGVRDESESALANIPIALISPGGDGRPATADDRIIGWAQSDQDGNYQFSNGLAGVYYLATPQTAGGYTPTEFSGDPDSETNPFTRFAPLSWRTDTFTQFQDVSDLTYHLALAKTESTNIAGVVAHDKNGNAVWDDPISTGANGATVELLDAKNWLLGIATTKTDGFGQPGRFLLSINEDATAEQLAEARLRFTLKTPFVGGTENASGDYQVEIPLDDRNFYAALIQEPAEGFDTSDAPLSYGVAYHPASTDLTLGLISDSDVPAVTNEDDLPKTPITNDDQDQLDDEEGIFFADGGRGTTVDKDNQVIVVMRNQQTFVKRLNGWIDFNGDGQFSEDEKIISNHQLFPKSNPQAERFNYTIPADAACGRTFARFRLGNENSQPDGIDISGEVEDIPYDIECVTDLAITMYPESTPIGPNELSRWFVAITNRGQSPAIDVQASITIPSPFNYQGLVSLTNDPVACTDIDTARVQETIECQIPELTAGQGITLSLSYFLPFDTDARVINSIATASSKTNDPDPSNNLASNSVKVEKTWLLVDPTYEAFTHVSFFPGIIDNPDNREADFKQQNAIATVINVPISITIGVDTNRLPRLTVQTCLDNPEDLNCNSTNFIEGTVIQENYGIERIFYEDDLIYEPENVQVVRLNRISDPNMARCGALGTCVGYDLFRVGRGDVRPYAWNAPTDYFYMGFFTSGGRIVRCPEEGYDNRCFIQYDAKPGDYDVEGFATINLVFEDTRLGPEPVIVKRYLKFRSRIRVFAPFIEPER